jgi:hypothetical protein
MQGHGSDSMLNRGKLSIFDPNYTTFEQYGAPNKQKVTSSTFIDNILPTQWPRKTMISGNTVNRQISISGFMYVCTGPNSGTIA